MTIRLRRRRAHAKLDRPFDHGEALPLTIDSHRRWPQSLIFTTRASASLTCLVSPLAQCPFRRTVDACVRVVAVKVEQLTGQRLPLRW